MGWRERARHGSIKWPKILIHREEAVPRWTADTSFERQERLPQDRIYTGSFFLLLLFLLSQYRRLHDNEHSKEAREGRGSSGKSLPGSWSRASPRNREKLCVTTRYFFAGVYIRRCPSGIDVHFFKRYLEPRSGGEIFLVRNLDRGVVVYFSFRSSVTMIERTIFIPACVRNTHILGSRDKIS